MAMMTDIDATRIPAELAQAVYTCNHHRRNKLLVAPDRSKMFDRKEILRTYHSSQSLMRMLFGWHDAEITEHRKYTYYLYLRDRVAAAYSTAAAQEIIAIMAEAEAASEARRLAKEAQRMDVKRVQREHDELVHRLRAEAIALAAEENIPVADAIEYLTGDVDLRKEIRVLLTWTPAREAAKAERDRRWEEFSAIGAREWREAYETLEREWTFTRDLNLYRQLGILVEYMRGGRRLRRAGFLLWEAEKYGKGGVL
jgi:hypothetical protein